MKKNLAKIELKKNSNAILNEDELNQLKGGSDIYNTNSVSSCICNFNNHSVIYNQNSVGGCSCTCN